MRKTMNVSKNRPSHQKDATVVGKDFAGRRIEKTVDTTVVASGNTVATVAAPVVAIVAASVVAIAAASAVVATAVVATAVVV
jgi:hypothetical protein